MSVKVHCSYDEMVDITQVIPNPRNPNTHSDKQIELLAKIINYQGWRAPITVSKRSGFIVRGHGRLMAAQVLDLDTVPVDYQDYANEAEEWADLVADNRIAELAEIDNTLLKELIEEVDTETFDIELTGFDVDEIENMMAEYNIINGTGESRSEDGFNIEAEIEKVTEPLTKYGDVWKLGEHRLLCGDSRNPKHIKKLMKGEKATICFTSPPYADQREYDTNSEFEPIAHDEYVEWFNPVAENIKNSLTENGCFFLNIKEDVVGGERSLYVMQLCLHLRQQIGFKYIDQLIWRKPGLPGFWGSRLRNDFEPVHFFAKDLYGVDCYLYEWSFDQDDLNLDNMMVDSYGNIYHFAKQTKFKFFPKRKGKKSDRIRKYSRNHTTTTNTGNIGISGEYKSGIALPSNVIDIEGNQENIKHPAMYSVKLVEWFLTVFSSRNDIVFEPFAGGGTNFIAAENLKRVCYGIEVSPKYCDIIVKRWEKHTGRKAEKMEVGAM